ncbi:TPA: VENN motif pre-toxin domain-containing protein, partial [Escherichia coli]|nr:VENN motif pre-toxin domain-containing protein [Escherichia coli]
ITIRDRDNQKQNLANLSRDPAHANDSISPIFDKEKEQRRLQTVGLISDIGSQVADIARTQGELNALKAAQDKYGPVPADATEEQRQAYLAKLRDTPEYKKEQEKYGTGSDMQRGIQAATAALQGLAGGNMAGALAGASAPELANIIGHHAGIDDNTAAKAIAHAILGGVTAALQGNSAAAGAIGAGTGEVIASAIAKSLYPGVDPSKLTEDQKQTVSTLATLSAGMAGGIASGDVAGAAAGAGAGKNVVENNALSLPSGMVSYGQAVSSWNQYADANNLTPEQKQAGLDKIAKGELPEGANISKVIVDGYKDGVLIAGAWYLGPAASVGKVIGGGVIAEIANGTYQWFDLSQPGNENKNWDWKSSASAGITGMLAPGRTVGQNVGIAMGSAFFTDGPNAGAIGGAAAGAWAGGLFGEYAPGIVNSVTGKEIPGFVYDYWGGVASEFSSGFIKDLNKPKGSSEDKKK